ETLADGPPAALPAVAGPHRLEERLLGSEARRERALRHGDPEAVGELVGCEQPAESALAATLAEPREACDQNELDSRADDHGCIIRPRHRRGARGQSGTPAACAE